MRFYKGFGPIVLSTLHLVVVYWILWPQRMMRKSFFPFKRRALCDKFSGKLFWTKLFYLVEFLLLPFFLPSHEIWELFQGQTTYSRELTYAHCNKSENSDWKLQTIKKRYLEWYGLKKISGMIWVLIKKMWLVQFNFKIPMHVEIRNRNSLTKVQ